MAPTRIEVDRKLRKMASLSAEVGLETRDRDGAPFSDNLVNYFYRDVKRCIFCGNRSIDMSLNTMTLKPPLTTALGGPSDPHIRLLFWGVCRAHAHLMENDPERGNARLDAILQSNLAERMASKSRMN